MNKLTLMSAMLAAACAVPALAHDEPRPDPYGDAMVSKADAEARAGERFAQLDADHDGSLTHAERRAGFAGRGFGGPPARGRGNVGGPDRFAPSGPQTKDQYLAAQEQLFDRLDTDHDGTLTSDERRAGGRGFGAARRGGPGGPRWFARGPQTHDGYVAAEMQRFDRLDADHDGQLTKAERDAAWQQMRERFHSRGGPGRGS